MPKFCGIDPGSVTGCVILDVPDGLSLQGARWLTSERFYPSKASALREPERDADLWRRMTRFLSGHGVELVAIETASEAKSAYRGRTKQRTDTSFRMGQYATIATLAAVNADAEVHTYQAVDSKLLGPGWMGNSRREIVVKNLLNLLRVVGAPKAMLELGSDGDLKHHHEGDALGVLVFCMAELALERRLSA